MLKNSKKRIFLYIKRHINNDANFSNVFFFRQIKIIVYFKFTIIKKILINQISKISNSMNFRQYTFAKIIRVNFLFFIFTKLNLKKSIVSSYKMLCIFDDIFFTFSRNFLSFIRVFRLNHKHNINYEYCNKLIEFHSINQLKVTFY